MMTDINRDKRIYQKGFVLILLSIIGISIAGTGLMMMTIGFFALVGSFIGYKYWNVEQRTISARADYQTAEARYLNALAMERETSARFKTVTAGHGILSFLDGDLQYWHSRTIPDQTPGTMQRPTERMKPALPAIRNSLCLVLLGPQGTGKTTLLKHLIAHRQDEGESIVIDPHGIPEDYNGLIPVGMGRDYEEIDGCLSDLMDELNRRYQTFPAEHERLWIYIDETTLLNRNCPTWGPFIEVMLTESRKVNMRVTLCLHSRRSKFLGLKGAMDLAEGIDFLTLKNENGRRWGELETDNGVINLALPGEYQGGVTSYCHTEKTGCHAYDTGVYTNDTYDTMTDETPYIGYDPDAGEYVQWEPEPMRIYESEQDKRICEMYLNGNSLNEIIKTCLGKTPNGRYANQVKSVLSQYGLI